MTTAELAKTALTAAAPEVAIPAELALSLVGRARGRREQDQAAEVRGDVVLVPPPVKPLLLELTKAKYRVVRRRGVRIVTVTPAKGLTTTETIVVGSLGLAAYGVWLAAHAIQQDLSSLSHPLGAHATWYEPWTWGH